MFVVTVFKACHREIYLSSSLTVVFWPFLLGRRTTWFLMGLVSADQSREAALTLFSVSCVFVFAFV